MPIDKPYCERLGDRAEVHYIDDKIIGFKCLRIKYEGIRVYCEAVGAYGCALLSRLEKAAKITNNENNKKGK
jgi:hypothetical protein